jgi:hypothetical protein
MPLHNRYPPPRSNANGGFFIIFRAGLELFSKKV